MTHQRKAAIDTGTAQLPFTGIVREGRTLICPELAGRILHETNYEGQRKIDLSQVGTYTEMMRRGLWLSGGQIAFGRLNGVLHLVNGQHRLSAVVQVGVAHEFQVLISECRDVNELRELYWRFDAVMKPRTLEQILKASGAADDNGVSRTMTTAVYRHCELAEAIETALVIAAGVTGCPPIAAAAQHVTLQNRTATRVHIGEIADGRGGRRVQVILGSD